MLKTDSVEVRRELVKKPGDAEEFDLKTSQN
jgi:hypothetical protein